MRAEDLRGRAGIRGLASWLDPFVYKVQSRCPAGVAENNHNWSGNTRHFHPDAHKQIAGNDLVPSFRDPWPTEAQFRARRSFYPVFTRLPDGGNPLHCAERSSMAASRTAGPGAQAAKPARTQPGEAILPLYPEILRGLPLGVVVLHLENPQDVKSFRIIDLNPAAAHITGATLESLHGRTLAEFPKLLKTPFLGRCLDALLTREPKDLGEIFYGDELIRQGTYSVQVFPLPGNFMGVAFENVTERKIAEQALRESDQRFRLLVEGVKEYAIFRLDPQGHVVSWNAGAERLKGYRAEEIIGKHFSVLYPREDVMSGKPERKLVEAAQRGQSEDEGWRIRKDGSHFWANAVITALRDPEGNLHGFAKLTRDMTES